jgi:hypothetical protein
LILVGILGSSRRKITSLDDRKQGAETNIPFQRFGYEAIKLCVSSDTHLISLNRMTLANNR